jgi:hypothetical protein
MIGRKKREDREGQKIQHSSQGHTPRDTYPVTYFLQLGSMFNFYHLTTMPWKYESINGLAIL